MELGSGLVSLMVLVVMLLLSLSVLVEVSIAAREPEAGELSDLESDGRSELQATPEESLVAGLSGASV